MSYFGHSVLLELHLNPDFVSQSLLNLNVWGQNTLRSTKQQEHDKFSLKMEYVCVVSPSVALVCLPLTQ